MSNKKNTSLFQNLALVIHNSWPKKVPKNKYIEELTPNVNTERGIFGPLNLLLILFSLDRCLWPRSHFSISDHRARLMKYVPLSTLQLHLYQNHGTVIACKKKHAFGFVILVMKEFIPLDISLIDNKCFKFNIINHLINQSLFLIFSIIYAEIKF